MADDTPRVSERQRTLSFYELVKVEAGGHSTVRMSHSPWPKILETLAGLPLSERIVEKSGRILVAEVLRVDGGFHLKLAKVRDRASWLNIYRSDAESIEDLDLADNEMLLEVSIVCFLDYGNIVGIVQGSNAAPGPSSLADWINARGLLAKGDQIEVQALISAEVARKLRQADEAASIETTVHTSRASALENRGSGLGGYLRRIEEQYGPMKVTMILQAPRSKGREQSETRQKLLSEARNLEEVSDDTVRAKARLLFIAPDEEVSRDDVNFIKQRITAKRMIPTTADDGSPIRDVSAVRVMLEYAEENERELREIVKS